MKKLPVALGMLLCLLSVPSFAQGTSSAKPSKGDWAMIFNFENLIAAVAPYDDGFQSGVGVKYWFKDNLGARALAYVFVDPDPVSDTSTTTVGVSAVCEYHPLPGRASPYLGGILGTRFLFEPDQSFMNFCLGALGGMEVRLFQNFALYAEYQALLVRDDDGISFKFGYDAVLGFLIYF